MSRNLVIFLLILIASSFASGSLSSLKYAASQLVYYGMLEVKIPNFALIARTSDFFTIGHGSDVSFMSDVVRASLFVTSLFSSILGLC